MIFLDAVLHHALLLEIKKHIKNLILIGALSNDHNEFDQTTAGRTDSG